MVAIICAVIGLVVNTISCLCVKELPEEESTIQEAKLQDDKISFVQSLKLLVSNKYYVLIVGIYIVYYFMSNLTTGSAIYFMENHYGRRGAPWYVFDDEDVPGYIALIFTPILVKKTRSMQKLISGDISSVIFWGFS